jgi:hypothetical protein
MISLRNHSDHDAANNFEDLAIDPSPMPSEIVDDLNGWTERGSPECGFTEREEKKITLQAEQMSALWGWLIGYHKDKKTRSIGSRYRFDPKVKEIGARVLAMLVRLRPDMLGGLSQTELAKVAKISAASFSHYSLSFAKSFPGASKMRCKSKSVSEAKRKSHRN